MEYTLSGFFMLGFAALSPTYVLRPLVWAAEYAFYDVSNRTCSTSAATLIRKAVYLKCGRRALPGCFNLQPGKSVTISCLAAKNKTAF